MPLEEVHARARKLRRRVRFRNLREYAAAAVAMVVFGLSTRSVPNPVMRIGAGLMIAGMLYVVYQLHKRGSSREITGDCLEYYRRELERQRDAVSSVWRWYLGPMIPGLLVIALGSLHKSRSTGHTWFVLVYLAVCGPAFYGIGKLNQRAGRRLQRQIDELDRWR
jgi:drug/metabolite transporter (DMT)-like permease